MRASACVRAWHDLDLLWRRLHVLKRLPVVLKEEEKSGKPDTDFLFFVLFLPRMSRRIRIGWRWRWGVYWLPLIKNACRDAACSTAASTSNRWRRRIAHSVRIACSKLFSERRPETTIYPNKICCVLCYQRKRRPKMDEQLLPAKQSNFKTLSKNLILERVRDNISC